MTSIDQRTKNFLKYGKAYPGVLDRVSTFFKGSPMEGMVTVPDVNFLGERFTLGKHNDHLLIQKGYNTNVTVFAIVDKLASIASLPSWGVYEVVDQKAYQRQKALSQNPYSVNNQLELTKARVKALRPAESHPFQKVLDNPNPQMSAADYNKALLSYQWITGDLYEYANMTKRGEVVELWPMPSQWTVIKNNGSWPMRETGYELNLGGQIIPIEKVKVNHVARFNPNFDGNGSNLYGMSPLDAAWINAIQDNEARFAATEILKNRGYRGLLAIYNDKVSPDFAKEQVGVLEERFRQKAKEYKDDLALFFGDAKFIATGLSVKDMAILEICNLNKDDLCNAYGISSILLNNNDHSSYNNFVTARKDAITSVSMPTLGALANGRTRWLREMDATFKRGNGKQYVVDFDQTVYTELYSEMKVILDAMREAEIFSDNEMRMAVNWEASADPNAEKTWKTTNKRPSDLLATAAVGGTSKDTTTTEKEDNNE